MKMTILHSCCCWNSVRKGSVACGVYTGFYFTLNAAHSAFLLHEEIGFLRNVSNQSLIDHDITSQTSAAFSALIFLFSSCGVVTTMMLFYGIYKDVKYLMVPWIFNMACFTLVDVIFIIYGLIVHALQWNPSVAILVTMDFFLNTLNLYALLCVISQYQEYKAGRGRAIDDERIRVPNILYSTTQPTATSYLSSHNRKPVTFFDKATPTNSPTGQIPNHDLTPTMTNRGPRKSVKFGDSSEMGLVAPPVWADTTKLSVQTKGGADTTPLIDSGGGFNV